MPGKKKKPAFSAAKAVRANARERLGQPKPVRILRDRPAEELREAKHRQTTADLLVRSADE